MASCPGSIQPVDHCRDCINGAYLYQPGLKDCHNECDRILDDMGIAAPYLERLSPTERKKWKSIQKHWPIITIM